MAWHNRLAIGLAICGGILLGCILAEWVPKINIWSILALGLGACLWFVWPKAILRISLIGLISVIGGIALWQHAYKTWNIHLPINRNVEVVGWLTEPLQLNPNGSRAIINVEKIDNQSMENTKFAVYIANQPDLHYGDKIRFRAKLENLPSFSGFDGKKYWRVRGVQSQVHITQYETVSDGNHGKWFYGKLYTLREFISRRVSESIKNPESSLLIGLLFGDQGQLPKEITNQFKVLGISHITAVSGYNLTIIALWPALLAGLIPKRWALFLSALLALLFVIFTGAPASIIRAAVMAWVVIIGKYIGREPHSLLLILLTATAMAVANPFVVKDDAGFILSFLAFFGLIEIAPLVRPAVKWLHFPTLISISSETLGAQIAAMPYLLGGFGQFSLVAPIANLIILPAMPAVMFLGLSAVGLVSLPLGKLRELGGLIYFPLHWFLQLINWGSGLPYTSITWPAGSLFPLYLAMVIFGWWLWVQVNARRSKSTV